MVRVDKVGKTWWEIVKNWVKMVGNSKTLAGDLKICG